MNKPSGFSLLEVLVALFLISICCVTLNQAFLQLQTKSKSAFYLYVATEQLRNVSDYYRVNKKLDSEYLRSIHEYLAMALPNGHLEFVGSPAPVELNIYWGAMTECHSNHIGVSGCLRFHLNV